MEIQYCTKEDHRSYGVQALEVQNLTWAGTRNEIKFIFLQTSYGNKCTLYLNIVNDMNCLCDMQIKICTNEEPSVLSKPWGSKE